MTGKPWFERLCLFTLAGSHAYGTATPSSDMDYRGVAVPPSDALLGWHRWEQWRRDDPDLVIYSLSKFCRLALQGNPNIIEILFSPQDCVLQVSDVGQELLAMRRAFLSRRVFQTFGGYARAELAKMRTAGRVGKRAEEFARCGYDPKNAAHLIRLLRMGGEILRDGQVNVRRDDAAELLAIRQGAYRVDEIENMAEELDATLREAHEATTLPEEPETERVHRWLIAVHEQVVREGER